MKVIFLDIDGVLVPLTANNKGISLECCKRLIRILNFSGASIVISSSWRGHKHLLSILYDCFMTLNYDLEKKVIGETEHLTTGRGNEIQLWLDKNHGRGITHYCILDDDSFDLQEFEDKLVKTDYKVGLTRDDVEKALTILGDDTKKEE